MITLVANDVGPGLKLYVLLVSGQRLTLCFVVTNQVRFLPDVVLSIAGIVFINIIHIWTLPSWIKFSPFCIVFQFAALLAANVQYMTFQESDALSCNCNTTCCQLRRLNKFNDFKHYPGATMPLHNNCVVEYRFPFIPFNSGLRKKLFQLHWDLNQLITAQQN